VTTRKSFDKLMACMTSLLAYGRIDIVKIRRENATIENPYVT